MIATCLAYLGLSAQTASPKIDSLITLLHLSAQDTSRVNLLDALADRYRNLNQDETAAEYADSALDLAETLNYTVGIAQAYDMKGRIAADERHVDEAIQYCQEAIDIIEETGDKRSIATFCANAGDVLRLNHHPKVARAYYQTALKFYEDLEDFAGAAQMHLWLGKGNTGRGKPEALEHLELARQFFEEDGDTQNFAATLFAIGSYQRAQGNYQEALRCAETCVELYTRLGDSLNLGYTMDAIGVYNYYLGNYEDALKAFQAFLPLALASGDEMAIANCYRNLGIANYEISNYPEAMKCYLEALRIYDDGKHLANAAGVYNNLGGLYEKQQNNTESLANYQKALEGFRKSGNKRGQANVLCNIAKLQNSLQQPAQALEKYDAAIAMYKEIKGSYGLAGALIGIGSVYQTLGNYPEAINALQSGLKISKEIEWKGGIATGYIDAGYVMSLQATNAAEDDSAIAYLRNGLEIAQEIRLMEAVTDGYKYLSYAYEHRGETDSALQFVKQYITLNDSLLNDESKRQISQFRTQYEVDKAVAGEKVQEEKLLAEEKFRNDAELAQKTAQHELALAKERARREQMIAVEKVRYEMALADEKSAQEKTLAEQQLISERQLDEENTRHQVALAEQQARQEREKMAIRRRNELLYTGIGVCALILFFIAVYTRQREMKKKAIEKAQAAHRMAELELQSLRSQLNPHFMFNSLNAIQELILLDENDKSHMYLARFAKLLRMLLENANIPFIPLARELEFLELYLSLESLRVPDLAYQVEIDPRIQPAETMIPNMILQPYIENAIWHGLSPKPGVKKLQLQISAEGDAVRYVIKDNGIGRQKAREMKSRYRKEHRSRGMELLTRRFKLLSKEFGSDIVATVTDLTHDGVPAGTQVSILVPHTIRKQQPVIAVA